MRQKIKLNSSTGYNQPNLDVKSKILLESKLKTMTETDIRRFINLNEQFNQERNTSTKYRLTGTLNLFASNVLFNNTGPESYETFNDSVFINDQVTGSKNYKDSLNKNLLELNGWFGYRNPYTNTSTTPCSLIDMEPNRTLYNLSNSENWDIVLTYPYKNESKLGD